MKKRIQTTKAPQAIGPYSQAIQQGPFLFCSGQIPLDPATGELVYGGVKEQAIQVMKNINAILDEAGYQWSHVVKTTIFLADMSDFTTVNEVYAQFFQEPYPARSTVAVKTLPRNVLVEIEVIAYKA